MTEQDKSGLKALFDAVEPAGDIDKLEPLRPVTAHQQAIFDIRRETAQVVQTKCSKCGAWYETAKPSTAFREMFRCDCGELMSFEVPAIDFGALPGLGGVDERLQSGMKISEAIERASLWWDRAGRHQMRKDGIRGSDKAVSLDPESANYSPSGILNGQPWSDLDDRERLQIVKAWHLHFIWKPQTEN